MNAWYSSQGTHVSLQIKTHQVILFFYVQMNKEQKKDFKSFCHTPQIECDQDKDKSCVCFTKLLQKSLIVCS